MRWVNQLSNMRLSALYTFLIVFVPLCVLVCVNQAWIEAQQILRLQANQQLEHAKTAPSLALESDAQVKAFLSRHNLYVCMTTIPERIATLAEILAVLDLSLVKQVRIHIPQQCMRSSAPYVLPQALVSMDKVKIVPMVKDLGPLAKLVPAIEDLQVQDPDAALIVIDDDVIYPKGMITAYAHTLAKHPRAVSATMPARLQQEDANPPYSYQLSPRAWAQKADHMQLMVQGTGSYAFLLSQIDGDWLKQAAHLALSHQWMDCLWSDDLLISMALNRKNTPVRLMQSSQLAHAMLKPHPIASQYKPLHVQTGDRLSQWLGIQQALQATQARLSSCLLALAQMK